MSWMPSRASAERYDDLLATGGHPAVDGDEDGWSDRLAREHGITALPGRHFHARTPHLRIPFGGRSDAREALLERLAAV